MMIAVAASKKFNLRQTEFWAVLQFTARCCGNPFVIACRGRAGTSKQRPVLFALGKSIKADDVHESADSARSCPSSAWLLRCCGNNQRLRVDEIEILVNRPVVLSALPFPLVLPSKSSRLG